MNAEVLLERLLAPSAPLAYGVVAVCTISVPVTHGLGGWLVTGVRPRSLLLPFERLPGGTPAATGSDVAAATLLGSSAAVRSAAAFDAAVCLQLLSWVSCLPDLVRVRELA